MFKSYLINNDACMPLERFIKINTSFKSQWWFRDTDIIFQDLKCLDHSQYTELFISSHGNNQYSGYLQTIYLQFESRRPPIEYSSLQRL